MHSAESNNQMGTTEEVGKDCEEEEAEEGVRPADGDKRESLNPPGPAGLRCPPHYWLVDCCNAPPNGPGVTCDAEVCWDCGLEDPRRHCVMQRPGREGSGMAP